MQFGFIQLLQDDTLDEVECYQLHGKGLRAGLFIWSPWNFQCIVAFFAHFITNRWTLLQLGKGSEIFNIQWLCVVFLLARAICLGRVRIWTRSGFVLNSMSYTVNNLPESTFFRIQFNCNIVMWGQQYTCRNRRPTSDAAAASLEAADVQA